MCELFLFEKVLLSEYVPEISKKVYRYQNNRLLVIFTICIERGYDEKG